MRARRKGLGFSVVEGHNGLELPVEVAERSSSVIYFLDSGLRIRYCNPAWDRFARENGGQGWLGERARGRALMSVIPEPLRRFFDEAFAVATSAPVEFDYECSSAQRYRLFHMQILPQRGGFAVVNSMRMNGGHGSRIPCPPYPRRYLGSAACFIMCAQCRRTRHASHAEHWDWVPAYVEHPPAPVIAGLCPACQETYYGASHHAKLECCG